MRLGLFAFVIPFTFALNQELIYWEGAQTFVTFFAISVGLLIMAIGLVGYDIRKNTPIWQRLVYFAVAAAIFFVPIYSVKIVLAVVGAGWLAFQSVRTGGIPVPEFANR